MKIRLLLADDHTMLRQGLRRALEEDERFEVIAEAASGDEAVRLAMALRPDVVLMDVTMPFMDGVAATREITSRLPNTRIVMLTMHHDPEVAQRAIRAGATGYLVKDCSLEEVRSTIVMAASGDTAVSPDLAASMLGEARRLQQLGSEDEKVISRREEEVLQLIADGASARGGVKTVHQPEDGQEPLGVDLREARRQGPHAGGAAGRAPRHRQAPIASDPQDALKGSQTIGPRALLTPAGQGRYLSVQEDIKASSTPDPYASNGSY
jgi:DNA-binding NarL/FixJ family response regulator